MPSSGVWSSWEQPLPSCSSCLGLIEALCVLSAIKGICRKSCLRCSPLPLWFWVCLVLYRRRLFGRRWRKQAQRFTSYSSLPCLGTPDGSRRNLFQRGLLNESRLSLSLFMDVDRSNGSWWSCVPTGVD